VSTQPQVAPSIQSFTPTAGRLLVKRIPGAKASEIIHAPECVKLTYCQAEVLACGPIRTDADGNERPLAVKEGDVIYFGRFADKEDGQYALIQEDDVILRRINLDSSWQNSLGHSGMKDGEYWMTRWRPVRDRIIVQAEETPQSSVIATPKTAEQDTRRGRVLAVGTGKYAEYDALREGPDYSRVFPLECKVGDCIEFYTVAGSEFTLYGNKYLVMRDADILGVWR
jgi:chaperonin GroES